MARTDFSRRAATPELMDIEPVGYADFRACLRDLAKVNRLTLGYRPTLAFLDSVLAAGGLPVGRPLSILDAGYARRRAAYLEQNSGSWPMRVVPAPGGRSRIS